MNVSRSHPTLGFVKTQPSRVSALWTSPVWGANSEVVFPLQVPTPSSPTPSSLDKAAKDLVNVILSPGQKQESEGQPGPTVPEEKVNGDRVGRPTASEITGGALVLFTS